MDKLIETIFGITLEMNRNLKEGNFEEFEKLLIDRNLLMSKIDDLKNRQTNFEYSSKAQQLLTDILTIDQLMGPQVEKSLIETKALLNQIKRQKQVSKQYNPYNKQTNGVFLDSKR
ncbi:flagellar protein FliT [Neobacillus drentensis]|uniref:flagellar protein FliT n=1 Tax=Neobacillus drentensis TaxID=220684 RepID=UPI002FFE277C